MLAQTLIPGEDTRCLEDWMRQRLRGRVSGLRLGFCDEGVILSGRTTSYYAKQLAQHTLLSATRLPLVANQIEVDRDSFRHAADDTWDDS